MQRPSYRDVLLGRHKMQEPREELVDEMSQPDPKVNGNQEDDTPPNDASASSWTSSATTVPFDLYVEAETEARLMAIRHRYQMHELEKENAKLEERLEHQKEMNKFLQDTVAHLQMDKDNQAQMNLPEMVKKMEQTMNQGIQKQFENVSTRISTLEETMEERFESMSCANKQGFQEMKTLVLKTMCVGLGPRPRVVMQKIVPPTTTVHVNAANGNASTSVTVIPLGGNSTGASVTAVPVAGTSASTSVTALPVEESPTATSVTAVPVEEEEVQVIGKSTGISEKAAKVVNKRGIDEIAEEFIRTKVRVSLKRKAKKQDFVDFDSSDDDYMPTEYFRRMSKKTTIKRRIQPPRKRVKRSMWREDHWHW